MTTQYSTDICRKIQLKFQGLNLSRPMRISRYDDGTELLYEIEGIEKRDITKVRLLVERFVGGGFAGQVYKVKIIDIQNNNPQDKPGGLQIGGVYGLKILVPPSGFSRIFRNFLYAVGFQGPFQLQVNPAAARAGGLWQKFIRRAAAIRFGDENTVADIYATLVDEKIGSCGELREWVEGRTWRLEADDRMGLLKLWQKGKIAGDNRLGSPEYRTKKEFMADFVRLLHDMGAYEFARQYEWWTCKSQPNSLKRYETEAEPEKGLVAVDFRPGLVLLPFLPMSPGDFKLIFTGICRGSLVQFDRGDVSKLETFVRSRSERFADMHPMLDELKADERIYRDSVPDVTQNIVRLFYDGHLWSTILDSAVTGWKVRNLIDESAEKNFRTSRIQTTLFMFTGLLPFFGKIIRRIWAQADWRKHYVSILTSLDYLGRAFRGKILEKTIDWYRKGRISSSQTIAIAQQPCRFFYHLPFLLLILPSLHRFLTDAEFRKEKLVFIFIRPFRLYFNAEAREQWLREMVAEGRKKHMLTDDDAATILSQISEPYIQKYLISLVVHLMTLPVTQMVSVSLALIYVFMHPEMPRAQVWAVAAGIIAFFQVIPISPGSLCRGLYVLYLVIRERNFSDYNIAVFLGFFKYIGYLSFPIQMTYRYPALARFMAGHWATEMVHIVPVFGEKGALLEHWVFCLFYNWPLTIRRRMARRSKIRSTLLPRYWHAIFCLIISALIFAIADFIYLNKNNEMPGLSGIWWLVILVPLVCGSAITLGCGGADLWKRIVTAAVAGALTAILATAAAAVISKGQIAASSFITLSATHTFISTLLSMIGAIVTELILPDPDLKNLAGTGVTNTATGAKN
jgi:hypothetical protein